jgi:murein L,D-transpeptidase YafK
MGWGGQQLNDRPLVRGLLASAALAAALLVAGCDTDGIAPVGRSMAPLSPAMLTEIEKRNMSKESPILVRLFKEESELEVWKETNEGRYALLKTYPICRWSGELGPKIKMGDRQAPEGFYSITPGLMNPNSNYYLAINTGFPNAYDRANERTGNFLMIHGDCSSAGCYAMTDQQISEIYALARESFFGGQRAFQIQAYPFRMTPLNMAKHRNSPHMAFWRMLKQGYDHFEVSRREPKVNVCEKRYVFDAETKGKFDPVAKCPPMAVNEELVAAVKDKQQDDDRQMAELVSKGTQTVAVRTGKDGGMHDVFLAAFKPPYADASGYIRTPRVSLPGTIPAHARPPGEPNASVSAFANVDATASVRSAPQSSASSSASQAPQSGSSGSLFGGLFSSNEQSVSSGIMDRMSRAVGLSGQQAPADTAAPKAKTAAKPPAKPAANAGAIRPATRPEQQTAKVEAPPAKPEAPAAPAKSADSSGALSGSQPTVPTGGFDMRWGTFR